MRKKDFTLIAVVFRTHVEMHQNEIDKSTSPDDRQFHSISGYEVESLANTLAKVLKSQHPRFNVELFLQSCGVKDNDIG